jgi:hypothetical protein
MLLIIKHHIKHPTILPERSEVITHIFRYVQEMRKCVAFYHSLLDYGKSVKGLGFNIDPQNYTSHYIQI